MRRVNRKIARGTLGHRDNPVVQAYNAKYNIGDGLCFKVITMFGDSKYSHDMCAFISEKRTNDKTSGMKFNDIIREFNERKN